MLSMNSGLNWCWGQRGLNSVEKAYTKKRERERERERESSKELVNNSVAGQEIKALTFRLIIVSQATSAIYTIPDQHLKTLPN